MNANIIPSANKTRVVAFMLPLLCLWLEAAAQNFWQQTNGPYGGVVQALAINSSGHIFAGTFGGGVFLSTDNGSSWMTVNIGLTNTNVRALAINSSGVIFAGTNGSGTFRSTDNGGSWTAVNTGLIHIVLSLAINSSGHIFAGTLGRGVFRSMDNGSSWTAINTGLTNNFVYALAINLSGDIFAGTGGGVFRSTDNGGNWTAVNTGLTNTSIRALVINSSGHIFAGTDGGMFRSTDNGDNWVAVNTGLTNTLVDALATNSSGHIFAGTFVGVFRSTNNGGNWTAVNTGLTNTLVVALAINSSGHIFAGTFGGGVFLSTDNGGSWMTVNIGLTNTDVRTLAINSSGHIFAGTEGSGMFRSMDYGDSWTAVNSGLTNNFVRALAINSSGGIFAGTAYEVFRSMDNGGSWTIVTTGLTNIIAFGINLSGDIFAGANGGGVFRSLDNGDSWAAVNNGLINTFVRALAINSSGDIFAGTGGGGVFRSLDNGDSWAAVNTGLINTDIQTLVINTSGHIFAGTNGGGVFRSLDNGDNWTTINTGLTNNIVTDLAINSSGDIFVGTVDGVFRSTDNGGNWTAVNTGLTNILVEALAINSSGHIFAGTIGSGVFRSTQSMTTEQFTRGDIFEDTGDFLGCSWGDFDDDGYLDLFVTNGNDSNNMAQNNYLYYNKGDGSFTKIRTGDIVTEPNQSRGSTWGDYNNDGYLDLFVTNFPNESYLFQKQSGNLDFTKRVIFPDVGDFNSPSWADYDNDGDLDLFVSNFAGENLLFRNEGGTNPQFTKMSAGTVGSIVMGNNSTNMGSWADYNGDGYLDLYEANSSSATSVLHRNVGPLNYSFQTAPEAGPPFTIQGSSRSGSWGDYDNDGDLDLFVANGPRGSRESSFLYKNNGDGTFASGIIVFQGDIASSGGSCWGDYDNDGDLDLFVANNLGDNNFLYRNDGPPFYTFTKMDSTEVGKIVSDGGNSVSSAWADYDKNGFLDLFVTNTEGQKNFLYKNNGNSNHWINIKCVGTVSNKSAIGAKVSTKATINGKPTWQLQQISAQTAYFSQNSLNVEFGFGDATIIDSIKVEWPSGIKQTLTSVAVDRFLTITESAIPNQFPSAPTPSSPAANAFTNNTPALTFNVPSDADNDPLHFKVEIDDDGSFGAGTLPFESKTSTIGFSPTPPVAQGSGQVTYTVQSALPDGDYWWRVSAWDGRVYGPFSTARKFIVDVTKPFTSQRSPPRSAVGVPINTNIVVHVHDATSGVKQSDIKMKVNGNAVTPTSINGLVMDYTVTYDPPVDFGFLQTINVSIDAADSAGNVMTTDAYSFTTTTPNNSVPLAPTLASPAANAFTKNNKPALTFKVPQDSNGDPLHFRVEIDDDGNFAPIMLTAESKNSTTGFIPAPPVPQGLDSVTYTVQSSLLDGDYWWRVSAWDGQVYGNPSIVRRFVIDTTPASPITHNAVTSADFGQSKTISATINDNWGIKSAALFYRLGGASNYMSTNMTGIGNDYQGTIPSNSINLRGVEYYISAEDSADNTRSFPATTPQTKPQVIQVANGNLAFPFANPTPAKIYRMISVPFELNDKSVASVLGDEFPGTYDSTRWRLLRYLNDRYVEYGSSGFSNFEPGFGFWLITKDTTRLDAGAGKSVTTTDSFEIVLQPGWNQIGNPFYFSVNWSEVSKNGNVENPVGYKGSLNDQSGYEYNRTQLVPGEGYFVNNKESSQIIIEIPPKAATGTAAAKQVVGWRSALRGNEWALQITAASGRYLDKDNYIGCLNDAADEWDANDFSEAPFFADHISLYFPHREWPKYPDLYTGDFREVKSEGDYWDFVVKSEVAKSEVGRSEVVLRLAEVQNLPVEWRIILLDKTSRVAVNFGESKNYSFLPEAGKAVREFRVVVGKQDFIENNNLNLAGFPQDFVLAQNYPNPFNPETRINYELPATSHVKIAVYNLSGQFIRALFDGEQSAGRYTIAWDGITADGNRVASGVYLARMEAGKFTAVKKMILTK